MGVFNRRTTGGGILDVIRCDEPSYIIWKWHPDDTELGKNAKENSIRWGSTLTVKDGSVAVFVHQVGNELVQEYIEGPFSGTIETENLPVLATMLGALYNGNSPFQAEVYFINLARLIQVNFAVPFFDVFDSRVPEFGVPVAIRGTIGFEISNYKEFINLHKLDNYTLEDFKSQTKDAIIRIIKDIVANAPAEYDIPVVHLETKTSNINDDAASRVARRLYKSYGVTLTDLDIGVIEIDKTSDGYRELNAVTKDLTAETLKAKNKIKIKEITAAHRLGVAKELGKTALNLKEDSYERHSRTKQTYKKATNVFANISQGIIDVKNSVVSDLVKTDEDMPPVPEVAYYIAIDGEAQGSHTYSELEMMYRDGIINENSYVWKKGMKEWKHINEVPELNALFEEKEDMPPVPM